MPQILNEQTAVEDAFYREFREEFRREIARTIAREIFNDPNPDIPAILTKAQQALDIFGRR